MTRRAVAGLAAVAAFALAGCGSGSDSERLCATDPCSVTAVSVPDEPGVDAPQSTLTALPAPKAGEPLYPRIDGRLPFGLSDNSLDLEQTDIPQVVAIHAALGATLARMAIYWPGVEPTKGASEWARYDDIYRTFARAGVRVLWTIYSTPSWAGPSGTCSGVFCEGEPDAKHAPDLGAFAARVAQRYPLAAGIELRNEPNLGAPPRIGAGRYADELNVVYASVKNANPAMRVIGGGLSNNVGWEKYLATMLKAGAAKHMDALSFHPYAQIEPGAFREQFSAMERVLRANRATSLRVLPDEVGASTTQTTDNGKVFDEAGQAQRLLSQYKILDDPPPGFPLAGKVDAILFFTTVDKPATTGQEGYGWVRVKGDDGLFEPKRVFCEFRAVAAGLTEPFRGDDVVGAC